jgi:hypothetical protein
MKLMHILFLLLLFATLLRAKSRTRHKMRVKKSHLKLRKTRTKPKKEKNNDSDTSDDELDDEEHHHGKHHGEKIKLENELIKKGYEKMDMNYESLTLLKVHCGEFNDIVNDCLSQKNCGWCDHIKQCIPGNENGPMIACLKDFYFNPKNK